MTGLDAVRQDTLPYVPREHWSRWTAALKREYPNLTILGEMWDSDPKLVSFFQGGQARFDGVDSGIETLFDFPLYSAIRDGFARGAPLTRLSETLAADTNYVDASVLVPFLGLHDTSRFLNESGATPASLRLAFTFLLTTRGTPLIYYGDEIGMNGGGDPDNRRDFPGGWAEDEQNAFDADGRTAKQAAMHEHVNKLLKLRREFRPLRRGAMLDLAVARETYAFARTTPDDFAVVAINSSARHQDLAIPLASLNLEGTRSMTDRLGELGAVKITNDVLKLALPPRTAAVLTPDRTDVALVPANEAKEP
jgi:glycosidase